MYILITINLQIEIFSIKSALRYGLSLNWLRREKCVICMKTCMMKKRESIKVNSYFICPEIYPSWFGICSTASLSSFLAGVC